MDTSKRPNVFAGYKRRASESIGGSFASLKPLTLKTLKTLKADTSFPSSSTSAFASSASSDGGTKDCVKSLDTNSSRVRIAIEPDDDDDKGEATMDASKKKKKSARRPLACRFVHSHISSSAPLLALHSEEKSSSGGCGVGAETDAVKSSKKIFSLSQQRALDAAMSDANVFWTGPAGTGKTATTHALVDLWKQYLGPDCCDKGKVAVTATTGTAAINLCLNATTFWTALFLTPADVTSHSAEELAAKIGFVTAKEPTFRAKKLGALQHLLIDEVSMLTGTLLDYIDTLLSCVRGMPRAANGKPLPFGGVQVILIGDLCQLPPVEKKLVQVRVGEAVTMKEQHDYVFRAKCFQQTFKVCLLTEVFRQRDTKFVELLSRVRLGEVTDDDLDTLNARVGVDVSVDSVKPTMLYARRFNVLAQNLAQLKLLSTAEERFESIGAICLADEVLFAPRSVQNFKKAALERCMEKIQKDVNIGQGAAGEHVRPELVLKIGAQVSSAVNLDTKGGISNGTRGVVVDFCTPEEWNVSGVEGIHGFVPVDKVDSDSTCHARSRCGTTGHIASQFLYLNRRLPVVRFVTKQFNSCTNAMDTVERDVLVPFWRWARSEKSTGEAILTQIPLRLAWAQTVHGTQGATLSLVTLEPERAFEVGQIYVALSRCQTLEGLSLARPLTRAAILADPDAVAFSKGILV